MSLSELTIPIIGISPRNSYYSDKDNIAFSITQVVREFGKAYVFVPGLLDRHNYIAYGYNEASAGKKSTSVGHALTMAVQEVCKRENLSCAAKGHSSTQVRIIDWGEEVENNPVYQTNLSSILRLYDANSDFRKDIRAATLGSIKSRMDNNSETRKRIERTSVDSAVDSAVYYILGEVAFLESASALFGAIHLTYFYHQEWSVFEKYIQGDYGCERPDQSFRILNRQTNNLNEALNTV